MTPLEAAAAARDAADAIAAAAAAAAEEKVNKSGPARYSALDVLHSLYGMELSASQIQLEGRDGLAAAAVRQQAPGVPLPEGSQQQQQQQRGKQLVDGASTEGAAAAAPQASLSSSGVGVGRRPVQARNSCGDLFFRWQHEGPA
jgi:hypothetical protein